MTVVVSRQTCLWQVGQLSWRRIPQSCVAAFPAPEARTQCTPGTSPLTDICHKEMRSRYIIIIIYCWLILVIAQSTNRSGSPQGFSQVQILHTS